MDSGTSCIHLKVFIVIINNISSKQKKIVIFAETVCIYNVNPHAFFLASTLRFKDNLRFTQKIPH